MPNNKSETINEQQNKSAFTESAETLKARKAKDYTPNLNQIPKNET